MTSLCLVPYRFHETIRNLKKKIRLRFVLEGDDRELLSRVYEALQVNLGEGLQIYCTSLVNQPKEIRSVIVISNEAI